jgi:hypothetical protein
MNQKFLHLRRKNFLTEEKIITKLSQVNTNVEIDYSTFNGTGKKARFIDKDFGEWWSTPNNVFKGRIHPKRALEKQRIPLEKAINRIFEKHGDVVTIDVKTYIDMQTRARFFDRDFGEWWSSPSAICEGKGHYKRRLLKTRATCLKKYGVEWVSQCPEIFHKSRKWRTKTALIRHWKTGKELICTASYEVAFVNWANFNQIDFDWQIPITTQLLTPSGRKSIYFVDVFIKDGEFANTWIEIKGWFSPIGKRKWEWFHETYPNSQLWTYDRLVALGILVSKIKSYTNFKN